MTTTTQSATSQTSIAPTTNVPSTGGGVAAGATSTSGSSTPWGWIIAGILAAVVIAAAVLIIRRRSGQRHAIRAWRTELDPALDAVRVVRDLLSSATGETDDPTQRAGIDQQVDRAAQGLDHVVASAPTDDDRAAADATAQALRGLSFALEAERLLRGGARAPTAEQLAQADQSRRDRAADLDRTLARLAARAGSAPGPARERSARV